MSRSWLKPALTLILLALLAWLAPVEPLDPWKLLSPYKIAKMVFALALIQALGSALAQYMGPRSGALLTGFFGGLISSTATTASLARRSKIANSSTSASEMLTYLSATGAMLFEGMALVIAGVTEIHFNLLIIFTGPLIATFALIVLQYQKTENRRSSTKASSFKILPILKLALFIITILSFSKVSQNLFGQNGLLVLTSLVSLFEIHGSIIANVQLHELGAVDVHLLCGLLALSVAASYVSKLFLIGILGSTSFKTHALKRTLVLFISLFLSWLVAVRFG
jgi:uncharacterized membrane protein (DUF4010 family)